MDSRPKIEQSKYELVNNTFQEDRRYRLNETLEIEKFCIYPPPENPKFIGFIYNEDDDFMESDKKSDEGKIFLKHGLKFHLSLPEWDRNAYKLGCDIVIDILMKNKISFKIIKDQYRMSADPNQAGKDVTINAAYSPEKTISDWSMILSQITLALMDVKVNPGYRVEGTKSKREEPVLGSNYFTYRYYNEVTKKSSWPKDNPAKLIAVNVGNQPNYKEFIKVESVMQNK